MDLRDIVALSHEYGGDEFALAGGGNTSQKEEATLAVKASGVALRDIREDGFVLLRRSAVAATLSRAYSNDPFAREAEVKADLLAARLDPERGGRPSVEASLHEMIRHRLVVHTHPYAVNALLCARDAERHLRELFGDRALVVPPSDPGYVLAKKLEASLAGWRKSHATDPNLVFMLNHGLVVAADSVEEVRMLTAGVTAAIGARLPKLPDSGQRPASEAAARILPGLRMMLSGDGPLRVTALRDSALVRRFLEPGERAAALAPFTPDHIVYCRAAPLVVEFDGDPERFFAAFAHALEGYRQERSDTPRIVLIPGLGMLGAEDSKRSAETCLDVFEERLKIAFLSSAFGGPRHLSAEAIRFVETWEVESYRRAVAAAGGGGRVAGRVAVVTGGAQGLGRGIAEGLFAEGANVIIADLNAAAGEAFAAELNAKRAKNAARFVRADVTEPASLDALVAATVVAFGGVDLLVANAGVLRAGSLEDLPPADFDFVTRVNYTGYYLSVRAFAPVLKLQRRFAPNRLTDIVQISSKSGLIGSGRNFAYAGSKFGDIGLTQSFAFELMDGGVKVNSVCPGNYYEGPLWSDPKGGLFVQYLKAGKVPGAKNVDDVRRYYEGKTPMRRGCTPKDVVTAILYLVEQQYETGQALAVTGGQVMLH